MKAVTISPYFATDFLIMSDTHNFQKGFKCVWDIYFQPFICIHQYLKLSRAYLEKVLLALWTKYDMFFEQFKMKWEQVHLILNLKPIYFSRQTLKYLTTLIVSTFFFPFFLLQKIYIAFYPSSVSICKDLQKTIILSSGPFLIESIYIYSAMYL